MKKTLAILLFLFTVTASGSALAHGKHAHGKHVHGDAEMNVVLQDGELLIEIQGALASFIGFEHRPQNTQQAAAADRLQALMKDADRIFELTPEAGCAVETVVLESPVFDKKKASGATTKKQDEHHDLSAQYLFSCKNPARLKSITVRLFTLFEGMHSIRVQAIHEGRQMAAGLSRERPTLSF